MLFSAATDAATVTHETAHTEGGHKNSVELLFGGSTEFEDEKNTTVLLGAEYERHLTPVWGVAALAEYNFGDFKRSSIVGVAATARPVGSLKLLAAACAEFLEDDGAGSHHVSSGKTDPGHDVHSVFRFAAAWEFAYDSFLIAPTLSVDFAGETETILGYGILFGYGF